MGTARGYFGFTDEEHEAGIAAEEDRHARQLVATPLPAGAMECSECDHVETDAIFLDTETCSKCGGMLTAVDFDD